MLKSVELILILGYLAIAFRDFLVYSDCLMAQVCLSHHSMTLSYGGLSLLNCYLRLRSETVRHECVWKLRCSSSGKPHGRKHPTGIGLTVGSFQRLTATLAKEDSKSLQIYAQAFAWSTTGPHHSHGMQGMQMFYSSSSVKELGMVGLHVML